MSRRARTARGEADCVALGSHCASPARRAGAVHFHALVLSDVDVGLCMYGSGPGRVESGGVADSVLIFLFRLGPAPRGPRPRARHLTREHVPLADVLAGYPAISRARGSPRSRAPA